MPLRDGQFECTPNFDVLDRQVLEYSRADDSVTLCVTLCDFVFILLCVYGSFLSISKVFLYL